MQTRRMGIREAKIHLSRLLKDAQQGVEWIITDHGRPVARVVPVAEGSLTLADRIKRLEATGVVGPPNPKARRLPPPLPLAGEMAQRYLQEDRGS